MPTGHFSRFTLEIVGARRYIIDESADGQPAICRILGPTENESLVLSALLEAQEYPWLGRGPTLKETGGRLQILYRDKGVLYPAFYSEDSGCWMTVNARPLPFPERQPYGWRLMPNPRHAALQSLGRPEPKA